MIRGTKNEGYSSQSKERLTGDTLTTTGVKGESYEVVEGASGVVESRDIDSRAGIFSTLPSNSFNGNFE